MSEPAHWGAQAQSLVRAGRFGEAEAMLRRGLVEHPGNAPLSYGLGILLLARGDHEEGWRLYEHRRGMPDGPRTPQLSFPEWRGEPVETLVVLPEQGLGDQIMYARFVPHLVARGVRVTLFAPPPLVRLFAPLRAEVRRVDVPRADAWCFLGSLPRLVRPTPAAAYLPGSIGGDGICVMLQGNPSYAGDGVRSLPEPLASRFAPQARRLHPAVTGARDFQATADIVAGLELVIAVDTAVAHLAGAMGKPTWLLLPHDCDWRWGRAGETTAWYPSMRLFRQNIPGDWASVVRAVQTELGRR